MPAEKKEGYVYRNLPTEADNGSTLKKAVRGRRRVGSFGDSDPRTARVRVVTMTTLSSTATTASGRRKEAESVGALATCTVNVWEWWGQDWYGDGTRVGAVTVRSDWCCIELRMTYRVLRGGSFPSPTSGRPFRQNP